jgi:LysM repeat protein
MTDNITVKTGDTLIKIVKREYGLTNKTDIMNAVNLIKEKNNLKNINLIKVNQELILPEQLRLNNVTIFAENDKETLKTNEKNYYRANEIFGDTATKKQEFPNQGFVESALNLKTKATEYVENVVVNVKGFFTNETSRDAKMADIFAKQIGTWTKDGETVGGGFKLEQTDAYKYALSMNEGDYTIRETHAYFDNTKSDNNITLFATEEVNGKEYIAMRDKENKVHYFDKSNNLSKVEL